jgi:hypothetical protein
MAAAEGVERAEKGRITMSGSGIRLLGVLLVAMAVPAGVFAQAVNGNEQRQMQLGFKFAF